MSRIRRWLPRALFEALLIVVSILVALAVDEWRDHRARSARADEARAIFAHEIESNRALLQSPSYLPHHSRLQAEYQELTSAGSDQPGSLFESGVHPAPLRDAAWRSFSASSTLADFAPDEILVLSDLYRAQQDLERLNANFLAQFMAPRADRETPAYRRDEARSISMYLNDIVPHEQRLLQSYDAAVARLKSAAAK
ncbi:MAG TPA: hypothetical protein VF551_09855 [Chthoniobacterales bacterium]